MRTLVLHRAFSQRSRKTANNNQPQPAKKKTKRVLSEHFADAVSNGLSSWKFVIGQAIALAAWITLNTAPIAGVKPWDKNLTLLNLALSSQAAFAASFILISQNRRARKDRQLAEKDFKIDTQNARDILQINKKLDALLAVQKTPEVKVSYKINLPR